TPEAENNPPTHSHTEVHHNAGLRTAPRLPRGGRSRGRGRGGGHTDRPGRRRRLYDPARRGRVPHPHGRGGPVVTLDTLDMVGIAEDEAYLYGFAALDELDELADEAFRRFTEWGPGGY